MFACAIKFKFYTKKVDMSSKNKNLQIHKETKKKSKKLKKENKETKKTKYNVERKENQRENKDKPK